MDTYGVGMKAASAAIHKLNSFELLAVSYLRAAPKEEKKKLGKKKRKKAFLEICLALSSGTARQMTGS